ncbi:MAG: GAF domain-containing protein [Bacteroidota bacterium]
MYETSQIDISLSKAELYALLKKQTESLFEGENDAVANCANFSALLFQTLPDINWAGFYFLKESVHELILGPFQGKVACVRIPVGNGVCGTAAFKKETILVENVHEFPGHIACDSASNSEIVIPLLKDGELLGVLDIDSPVLKRFDAEDRTGLETLVSVFLKATTFKNLMHYYED